MLQPRLARYAFRKSVSICVRCQSRLADPISIQQTSARNFAAARTLRQPELEPKSTETTPPPGPKEEDVFTPRPLGRPIGFKHPPRAGQNIIVPKKKIDYTGMTLKERNLEKRKDLVERWGTNYFRDFKNIRKYRSGKTFMANSRIFKRDAALYFPNLHGDTLAEKDADTTTVLQGKISVVNVYSSQWGETQARTFTGKSQNPQLHNVMAQYPGFAQMVDINIEENSMKAWIISLFQWQLRGSRPKEDWGKYFVVRKGVSERIRETIGLLNGRVGYVYLVDQDCKIRWAGSADAEGNEVEDLNRGFNKLLSESL
ncbi:Mitochondrial ATPase complex subunit atp10 [Coniothyrium glycines]